MEAVRQYILSVVCASLICSVIRILSQDSIYKNHLKMITSLFLTITLLRPFVKLELPAITHLPFSFLQEAEYASAYGKEMYQKELTSRIQQTMESYIFSKDENLHMKLNVSFTMSNDDIPYPEQVTLSGTYTAAEKEQLSQQIAEGLGIPKERQIWIDGN